MISASVQPSLYSDIITSMQTSRPWGGPKGVFYLLDGVIVPYTPRPTIFTVKTNRIGEPIEISVVRPQETDAGVSLQNNVGSKTFVPTSETTSIGIQLSSGINKIQISVTGRPNEYVYLIVRATSIVALWEAFARVLYSSAVTVINEQQQAIYSPLGTRLIEPYISFQEKLPDIQSLQILATRFVSRGMIHDVGTTSGVTDLIKAFTLSTPVYRKMDKETFDFDPSLDPWTRTSSQFGGLEAHVWIPNIGIASWVSFIKYISNQPDIFQVVDINESQIAVTYQGRLQRHQYFFDLYGTEFLTSLAESECFKSIYVYLLITSEVITSICATSYTFDLYIDEQHPIGTGRLYFDSPIPFDSNVPLDSDPIDPFTDGWVGLSLTGRFEQNPKDPHCLDTTVAPSTSYMGPTCCYSSYYTQQLFNTQMNLELDIDIAVSGYIIDSIVLTLQDSNGVRWDVLVKPDGTIFTAPNSPRLPDRWKVTKPDATEAAFAVTTTGVLQVITPVGGEVLNNSIYLRASDNSVWWFSSDDLDEITTTQVY